MTPAFYLLPPRPCARSVPGATTTVLVASLALAGCQSVSMVPDAGHLHLAGDTPTTAGASSAGTGAIPPAVVTPPLPPAPQASAPEERYTVVVRQVPVQELLQAVARDARVNIDIHPAVRGVVSLNAVDQTLRQILQRISRLTNARFRMDGPNLVVEPDTPFLRTYAIDYLNANRLTDADIGASSQVSALSASSAGADSGAGAGGSNEKVATSMKHRFWETLTQNLKDLLREPAEPVVTTTGNSLQRMVEQPSPNAAGGSDTTTAAGSAAGPGTAGPATSATSANGNTGSGNTTAASAGGGTSSNLSPAGTGSSGNAAGNLVAAATSSGREPVLVIANPEAGVISVRATSRQHEHVQEFLDKVLGAAHRQVLIEATVVEVQLNDAYAAGIDWSRLPTAGGLAFNIGNAAQAGTLGTQAAAGNGGLAVRYTNGSVGSAINLLDTFGSTRVLSSPKLMALNNQTALLKVVDNLVYFNVTSSVVPGSNTSTAFAVTTATPRSVSVGLVMAVTPQISAAGAVSLIVRPTISRVLSYVTDPSTSQSVNAVPNLVPQIQVREMESILSVQSGQIAVLGGLMQQTVTRNTTTVPGLGQVQGLGQLFSNRNDSAGKTELVIFLRPVVVDRQTALPIEQPPIDSDFFRDRPAQPATVVPILPAPERRS